MNTENSNAELKRRVGNNILALRELHQQSQEELAHAVGRTGKTVVSNWETGRSLPDDRILSAIARHYNVTVEELMYSDLSCLAFDARYTDPEFLIKFAFNLFDTVSSEEALKNDSFKKAYKLDTAIINIIFDEASDEDIELLSQELPNVRDLWDIWEKCLLSYYDAFYSGIQEGGINYLRLLFFWELRWLTSDKEIPRYRSGKKYEKEFMKAFLVYGEESIDGQKNNDYEEKIKELHEAEEHVYQVIGELRKDPQYRDYLEYYIAQKFFFGVVSNDNALATNRKIGNDMLHNLAKTGNLYAVRFEMRQY